jgi:hypothetical protein
MYTYQDVNDSDSGEDEKDEENKDTITVNKVVHSIPLPPMLHQLGKDDKKNKVYPNSYPRESKGTGIYI